MRPIKLHNVKQQINNLNHTQQDQHNYLPWFTQYRLI